MNADAEMRTDPETQHALGLAVPDEVVGVGKFPRVAIGRGDQQDDALPDLQMLAGPLMGDLDGAAEPLGRRRESQRLLEGDGRVGLDIGADLGQLVGPARQFQQCGRDTAPSRRRAARDDPALRSRRHGDHADG